MNEKDWALIKQRAVEAGESVTDYLLRRALEPDNEAALRAAVFRLGAAGFHIMVEAGKAVRKSEKAFRARIRKQSDD